MAQTVIRTDFKDLNLVKRGKVRDIYDLGDKLLMVATDRISAFDVIMPDPIPGKGKILTQISLFWFEIMESLLPHHLISGNVDNFPEICKPYTEILRDRSMLVKKAKPLPIECVVRGYISGSGWKDYQTNGSICGIKLPQGLKESDKLPEPLFTPSTKEEIGLHDVNIDSDTVIAKIGETLANKVRKLSFAIYEKGADLAYEKGIIIADTKFEFGLFENDLILIDEVLTPDSSRFWPRESYKPNGAQESFDKQYLRDYLISINWNKKPPGPSLSETIVINTRRKYLEALNQLTDASHGL
ncbi:MAG: phosphoribosylaminoimidazolesuccinocarboxamide synthase [Deltaproteobacteria bacterium]|nr:phosphoribosylaminoimidazolesuccinocarboxamide synthase [Deltaproteobacteria bacterium]